LVVVMFSTAEAVSPVFAAAQSGARPSGTKGELKHFSALSLHHVRSPTGRRLDLPD